MNVVVDVYFEMVKKTNFVYTLSWIGGIILSVFEARSPYIAQIWP